jgi:alpha-D-xyloside xylohydrolase
MDFNGDTDAVKQPYEYMFGKAFLVAPITEARATQRELYLPKSTDWYDFWTGKRFNGGQTITTDAPLDKIPLFVKAGSIIPIGKFIEYAGQKSADSLEIHLYKGADGQFDLYEDEGDNYNYEKGSYTIIPFRWDEKSQTITIDDRQGEYPGFPVKRIFNIVFVNESIGIGNNISPMSKRILYNGKSIKMKI